LLVGVLILTVVALSVEKESVAIDGTNTLDDDVTDNPSLALTTSLISKRFCFGDGEVSTMQMKLRLRYKNTSRQPIILYKGSDLVPSLTVSRNLNDALSDKHELSLSFTTWVLRESAISERLNDQFQVLRSQASFVTESEVAIPFTTVRREPAPGTIALGSHVLQVRVSTWPDSLQRAKELRSRWSRYGYLWYETIEAAPMEFNIEAEPKYENCH
jgi:hypothetical protein